MTIRSAIVVSYALRLLLGATDLLHLIKSCWQGRSLLIVNWLEQTAELLPCSALLGLTVAEGRNMAIPDNLYGADERKRVFNRAFAECEAHAGPIAHAADDEAGVPGGISTGRAIPVVSGMMKKIHKIMAQP